VSSQTWPFGQFALVAHVQTPAATLHAEPLPVQSPSLVQPAWLPRTPTHTS
jgi:hypothetical protein